MTYVTNERTDERTTNKRTDERTTNKRTNERTKTRIRPRKCGNASQSRYTTVRFFNTASTDHPGELTIFGAHGRKQGICVVFTNATIVVGAWDATDNELHTAARANSTVTGLGQFLVDHGY